MNRPTLSLSAEDVTCCKMDGLHSSENSPSPINQKPWPPDGVKWYYHDDACCIAHADCREVLPLLPKVDLVLTDPPYGIGFAYESHDDSECKWFDLMDQVVPMLKNAARFVVMPCCQIKRLGWWYANHQPEWIIAWHKGSPWQRSTIGFNDWEPHLCWGRPTVKMHDHFSTRCGFTDNGHPCPKPIEYATWLISRSTQERQTILDPFMGSGTTLVAAKLLGRRAIGIEIEEKYCAIAVERLRQGVLLTV